jgi:hypothetical protein
MRGKWAVTAGAVLALVVVGGVGGLTVRAFAGTAHTKVVKKTVTRLCVYVDHKDKGASYGDLSVVPKYDHEVCITGKRGPAGNTSVITWNKSLTTAGSPPPAARRKTGGQISGPTTIDLATVGPFTVRGECWASDGVTTAVTDIISAQDGSSLSWDDSSWEGNFNSGSDAQASNDAVNNNPSNPTFVGEDYSGEFSVTTGDGATAFTGSASNGSYLNGAQSPPCSFSGYLVVEPAASAS